MYAYIKIIIISLCNPHGKHLIGFFLLFNMFVLGFISVYYALDLYMVSYYKTGSKNKNQWFLHWFKIFILIRCDFVTNGAHICKSLMKVTG